MRELWRRLAVLFRWRSIQRDLDDELRFHLEMKQRDTGDDAAARRAVGSPIRWREHARDAWGWRWLDEGWWDVRYACRRFRQSPGFTCVAVSMLGVGIGINTAVFTLANTVLFKGFPFIDHNDRILYIHTPNPRHPETPDGYSSYADFQEWRKAKSFEGLASATGALISLVDGTGFPENHEASRVSTNAFQLLRQTPLLGRDFTAADEQAGASPVILLSYTLWEGRFGKDPNVVGHVVHVDGTPTTIIGVMPRGVTFPYSEEAWVPLVVTPELQQRPGTRGNRLQPARRDLWLVFGRLSRGATVATARTEIGLIAQQLAEAYPDTNRDVRPVVQTYNEFWVGRRATVMYMCLLGAVGCVLLIACANVANLLLARGTARAREISVRIALGAGRGRIIRQLLIESVLLSAMSALFGWWLARWASAPVYKLAAFTVFGTPGWFDFGMDVRVLTYFAAISAATGILFGLAPAMRLSTLDLNATLKDGGHGAVSGRQRARTSGLLVMGEMAIAVILLGAAGIMTRSFLKIYTADLGVKTDRLFGVNVRLPRARYADADAWTRFLDRLGGQMQALPGVEGVTLTSALPTMFSTKLPLEAIGAPALDEDHRPLLSTVTVGSDYFRTFGATVLSGREFSDADTASSPPVAIVNQRFASATWPGENPIGRRVRTFTPTAPEAWRTVVGLVSNIVQDDPTRQTQEPIVYLPYRQRPSPSIALIARSSLPPASLGLSIRRMIQTMDPDLPIDGPWAVEHAIGSWNYGFNSSMAALFSIFAMVALLLASVGLYAVVAHMVSQRTQEIGVRLAIGASRPDILRLVCVQGLVPVGCGLLVGLTASLAVNRALASALVHVSPADPLSLAAACSILFTCGVVGCAIPAWRATQIDPLVALRHE